MSFSNIKKALGSGGIIAFGHNKNGVSLMIKWIKGTHGLHTYYDSGEGLKELGSVENIGSFENNQASEDVVIKTIKEKLNEQDRRIYRVSEPL